MTIETRLATIRTRIEVAGGDPDRVRIIAVTKGFGADVVAGALAAGLHDLGESYAQELAAKVDHLGPDLRDLPHWHFIGRLQTNKVRLVAEHVTLWHSVDRAKLVREIAARAPGAAILVQVDATGEPSKGGCPPEQVERLVDAARTAGLEVRGLMAMGHLEDRDRTAEAFGLTAGLARRLDLPELSMGMSGDLELAVTAGATMVRVGTALFGPRPDPAEVEH